ncbi:MAG: peptidoglycan DD-metalloendopeptidase family protein [Bacillota bacterium]|nr:peptidoglycan DD-metalloendopeptidase family protein [Bacillota bacterium]
MRRKCLALGLSMLITFQVLPISSFAAAGKNQSIVSIESNPVATSSKVTLLASEDPKTNVTESVYSSAYSVSAALNVKDFSSSEIYAARSDGNITVSWPDVTDAVYYQVEKKVDEGQYAKVGIKTVDTKFFDGDVFSGTTYNYRVSACNNIGENSTSKEVTVDYTIPMEDLGELRVDKDAAAVGKNSSFTFTITPKGRLAKNQGIELSLMDGTKIISKTMMQDDGNLSNGDSIKYDGVYSGIITVKQNAEKSLVCIASAQVSINDETKILNSANKVKINVISNITSPQINKFQQVLDGTNRLLSKLIKTQSADVVTKKVVAWLKSNPAVTAEGVSDGCDSIWFAMNSGIRGELPILPAGSASGSALIFDSEANLGEAKKTKMINISQLLRKSGNNTSIFEGANLTINKFKALEGRKVIAISCQGSLYNGTSYICSGEIATPAKISAYEKDLKAGRIIIVKTAGGSYFGILPDFITYYNRNLDNTVVFLASGRGLDNQKMWDAFNRLGAKLILGFNGDVYEDYSIESANKFFTGLNDGLTVDQAYNWTLNQIGNNDNAWKGTNKKPASYFKMYGEGNMALKNKRFIANSDFENGLYGWKVTGDARIISQLGQLKPEGGNKIVMIGDGIGSVKDSYGIIEQSFFIPSGSRTLSFEYNVVPEKPEGYSDNKKDKFGFAVQLYSGSKLLTQNNIKDNTASNSSSGWKHIDLEVSQYSGKYIKLKFSIWGIGKYSYNKAAVIDSVKINGLSNCDGLNDNYDSNKQYLYWPVESTQITLPFGKIDGLSDSNHGGIDIQGNSGDDVVSAATGKIVYTGTQEGYGNVVYINSEYGNKNIQTRYSHLSKISVEAGNIILEGEAIGKLGDTGNIVGGSVLGFEVLESTDGNACSIDGSNSKRVNPQDYLLSTRSSALDYLSFPFAIGSEPGDNLDTTSVENLTSQQKYERNLDLNQGEAYLEKLVSSFSINKDAIKQDISSETAVVELNGRTKYYGIETKYGNARKVNNHLVINIADFADYFYPALMQNEIYPGNVLTIDMKNQYNPYVLKAQQRLKELGYNLLRNQFLNINGHFDESTLKAVNAFKSINKIGVAGLWNGQIGALAWGVLFSSSAKKCSSEVQDYKVKLEAIKKLCPNWSFDTYDAGIPFDLFVLKQYNMNNPSPKIDVAKYKENDNTVITNRIIRIRNNISSARNFNDSDISKKFLTDGGFFLTTYSGQDFFADPLNFLGSSSIYSFLQLGFDENIQTRDGVKAMLQGTYFETDADNYTNWFYDSAKQYGVNPYFLVAKAIVEGGAGNKASASLLLTGYKYADETVVYNFFAIGAYDGNAIENGALYAKNNGWTTPQKAIEGGAKFIGNSYISVGQDTYYTMRYNLPGYKKTGAFTHQYASNIADAVVKGNTLGKKLGKYLIDKHMTFKIPIFREE